MAESILEIKNLSYTLNSQQVLFENLNLCVGTGNIYGLLGQNGAGKTTLLKQIFGITKFKKGEIRLLGENISDKDFNRAVLKNVGSLIETPALYDHLTAAQHLKMMCNIYSLNTRKIEETLQLVNLETSANKKTKAFSLGMKQRLAIAMALIHDPTFVVLDEPLNGLDHDGIVEIRKLIISLNKERNVTFLISNHNLPEMEVVATHLGILSRGKLVYEGINPSGLLECILPATLKASLRQSIVESGFRVTEFNNTIGIYFAKEQEESLRGLLHELHSELVIRRCSVENLYHRYTA